MPQRKAISLRKEITAPLIVKELELIEQETNQGYNVIVYNILVEKIYERIREREMCNCIINDRLTVNVLKYEVNRVLAKYPVK